MLCNGELRGYGDLKGVSSVIEAEETSLTYMQRGPPSPQKSIA